LDDGLSGDGAVWLKRRANYNVVLGWQLQNEYCRIKNRPALFLNEGLVEIEMFGTAEGQ
jgi:hypothetical protein